MIRRLATLLVLAAALPATAQEVEIEPAADGFRIRAREAAGDEVLARLAEADGFAIERKGAGGEGPPLSGTRTGRPDALVPWILRGWNYLLVYEGDAGPEGGRIERVLLLGPVGAMGAFTPDYEVGVDPYGDPELMRDETLPGEPPPAFNPEPPPGWSE